MLRLPRSYVPSCLRLLPWLALCPVSCSNDPRADGESSGEAHEDGGLAGEVRHDASTAVRETGAQCGDGKDNDRNGKTDCDDASCQNAAKCASDGKPDVSYSNDGGSDACSTARADGIPRKLPVDVVWVIDDSLSMLDDITRVQQNMATFAQSLVQAGLDDYHIIVLNEPSLTAGAPWDAAVLGLDPARFFPVSVIAFNDCLTPTLASFSSWSGNLRPEAALHFIMVTDDNSLLSWSDFDAQMSMLVEGKPYTMHAIVDPPEHCLGSTRPGTAYWEAAESTGGQQRSICEADWLPTFKAIEDSIQSTAVLPCEFDIPEAAAGQTYDRTSVNVQHTLDGTSTPFKRKGSPDDCGTEVGWYYDDPANPMQVRLCPAACTRIETQGGAINIDFVCEDMVYL